MRLYLKTFLIKHIFFLTSTGITTVPTVVAQSNDTTTSVSSIDNASAAPTSITTLAGPLAIDKKPEDDIPDVLIVDATTEKPVHGQTATTSEIATSQKFAAAVNDSDSLAKIKPVLMAMNGVTDENVDELIAHIIDAQPEIKGRALNLSVPAVGHDAAAATAEVSDNGMSTPVSASGETVNYVTTMKPTAVAMKDLSDVSMDDDMDMMSAGVDDDEMVEKTATNPHIESTQPRQINGSIVAATAESVEHTMNECESNGKTYKV